MGEQVILLRDVTDHYLIDNEIGRLYRHELKAELDVIAVGLNMARQLVSEGLSDEASGRVWISWRRNGPNSVPCLRNA